MNIFETLDQNLKVFLSIFCGTKVNLEFIITSILDLPPPPPPPPIPTPFCLTHPLMLKCFQRPIIQHFEIKL